MSARLKVPLTAKRLDEFTFTMPRARFAGKRITLSLHEGQTSKGWRSNFELRPTRWFRVRIEGHQSLVWSYSGQRLEQANGDFYRNVRTCKEEVARAEKARELGESQRMRMFAITPA